MKKVFQITTEEYEAIKSAIEDVLSLWQYDFIEANSEDNSSTAMSKDTFFKSLESRFIIKD